MPDPTAVRPALTPNARNQLLLLLRLGAVGPDLGVTARDHAGLSAMTIGSLVRKRLAGKTHLPRTDCQPQRTAYWLTPAGLLEASARQAAGGPPLGSNQLAALEALQRMEQRGEPASTRRWRAEVFAEAGGGVVFHPEALERRGLVERLAGGAEPVFLITAAGRAALRAQGASHAR